MPLFSEAANIVGIAETAMAIVVLPMVVGISRLWGQFNRLEQRAEDDRRELTRVKAIIDQWLMSDD